MSEPVPYNAQAEESLLGAMLLKHSAVGVGIESVNTGDFYKPAHAHIFDAIVHVYRQGQNVDPVTVAEHLKRLELLDAIGGPAVLLSIQAHTPAVSNAKHYAKIVKDLSTRRKLMMVGHDITELAGHSALDIEDLLSVAERSVMDIATTGSEKGNRFVQASLATTAADIGSLWMSGDTLRGLSTGFTDLDKMISGLEKTKLYLCAARPGAGKTAFALNVSSHVALTSEKPVLFYSLEMSEAEINQRLTNALARISSFNLQNGRLTIDDWRRMAAVAADLDDAKLLIDDDATLSVDEMFLRARRAKSEHGELGLIVVDYIQLMSGEGDNRQLEISNISRKLKVMAKELDCPVVALSQLNRSLESRLDKRPMLSDLRESGSLEQDANTVIFLYRDELYNPETMYRGMPEIIVSKQRSGPTGMIRLAFIDEQTRFANLSREA